MDVTVIILECVLPSKPSQKDLYLVYIFTLYPYEVRLVHFPPASHVINKMSKVLDHIENRYRRVSIRRHNSKLWIHPTACESVDYCDSSRMDGLLIKHFNEINSLKERGTLRWLHTHISEDRNVQLQSCYLLSHRSSLSDQCTYLCVRMSHP